MPWNIEHRKEGFCVVRESDGHVEGCHPTEPEAEDQRKALHASEQKEEAMEKDGLTEKIKNGYVPPTTYNELDDLNDARELRYKFGRLADEFLELSQNILWSGETANVASSISALSQEFTERLATLDQMDKAIALSDNADQRLAKGDPGFWRSVVNKAREVMGRVEDESDSPFFIWKDVATDLYWWLAIYSNNYKDDDHPPEIITAAAHEEFAKEVDEGRWPMPELWLWHVPGSRVGRAKMVAYDKENGFAVAAGIFDSGREQVAEKLMNEKGILVSHGMPGSFIERDAENSSHIIRYRTREISPLPNWAAANKATGFVILNKKENVDMLPKEKVEFLKNLGLDADALDGQLKLAAEALAAAGVPSKEITPAEKIEKVEKTEETPEKVVVKAEAKDKDETPESTETDAETPDVDLGLIIAAAVQVGVEHALEAVVGPIKEISERIEALEASAKESDSLTPAASLADIIRSNVVGSPATKLDGRTKEAKDAPDQEKTIADGNTPFDVVNQIKAGQDWRAVLPSAR